MTVTACLSNESVHLLIFGMGLTDALELNP